MMRNSLSRRMVKRPIVEKPTYIEIEDIINQKEKVKRVDSKPGKLTGYAGYCFDLHFGGWKHD